MCVVCVCARARPYIGLRKCISISTGPLFYLANLVRHLEPLFQRACRGSFCGYGLHGKRADKKWHKILVKKSNVPLCLVWRTHLAYKMQLPSVRRQAKQRNMICQTLNPAATWLSNHSAFSAVGWSVLVTGHSWKVLNFLYMYCPWIRRLFADVFPNRKTKYLEWWRRI